MSMAFQILCIIFLLVFILKFLDLFYWATPPSKDKHDAGSHEVVPGKDRERGQGAVGSDKSRRWLCQYSMKVCKQIAESASKQRMGTTVTRNWLPPNLASWDISRIPQLQEHCTSPVSHQVEVDIPSFKQETDPQSSLCKTNIPFNTQVSVIPLTNAPDTRTTHVKEETPSIQDFENQEIYYVTNASQLLFLPDNLQRLTIKGCESLDVISSDLLDCLPILEDLCLVNCSSLRSIPYPASLTFLYIHECRKFELLPVLQSREKLSFLQHLLIGKSCDSLTTLSLNLFPNLKTLCIWDCPNFVSFNVTGVFMGYLALQRLVIKDCPGLNSFPDDGFHTPNLNSISLSNCKNLHKFPNFINSLTSLVSLSIRKCPHIESFPSGGLPSSLMILSIVHCDKLTSQKNWGLKNLESLTDLNIEGGCIGMESFPEENMLPNNIRFLRISMLKSLRKLDDKGFQQLNALYVLKVCYCEVLRYLPDQGFPSSLNHLYIKDCPMLTSKLKPNKEKYWCKVARVKHLEIDDQILS